MKTNKITRFNELASSEPKLRERLAQIYADAARSTAEQIAALSSQTASPFTAEEFLASTAPGSELSEAELQDVAGGSSSSYTTINQGGPSLCGKL